MVEANSYICQTFFEEVSKISLSSIGISLVHAFAIIFSLIDFSSKRNFLTKFQRFLKPYNPTFVFVSVTFG